MIAGKAALDIGKYLVDAVKLGLEIAKEKFEILITEAGQNAWDLAQEALEKARELFDDAKAAAGELAQWVLDTITDFGKAIRNSSPLVLDLDCDRIELNELDGSTVMWDLAGAGVAERTGWVLPDNGFLAFDANANRTVDDQSELFGTEDTDGFTLLSAHDSNGDGWIDAQDAGFGSFYVWRDFNQNGLSEDGELSLLADLGILRIPVEGDRVFRANAGHKVTHDATYDVQVNGVVESRKIQDIWFSYDAADTAHRTPYAFDPLVLLLRDVRGYGTVGSLHRRIMESDAAGGTLRAKIEALVEKSLPELLADPDALHAELRTIIFEWTGVQDVDPVSRGKNIDARMLHAMEALLGRDFRQCGSYENPYYWSGQDLYRAFDNVDQGAAARLLMQSALAGILAEPLIYDPGKDAF